MKYLPAYRQEGSRRMSATNHMTVYLKHKEK